MSTREVITGIVVALVVFWLGPHLISRGSPPLDCQLLGGQWTLLTGWTCR